MHVPWWSISFCESNLYLRRTEKETGQTGGTCRLTVRQMGRQTDRQADPGPREAGRGQMFPCRHRGEMFAMPGPCLPASPRSHQLAAWRFEPASAGLENQGQRDSHTYTDDEGATTKVSLVAGGKRNTSHTTPSGGEGSLLFHGPLCRCERDWFGLAGGRTECQSCHGGG